ncbi:MAG: glycosyltransferase [Candidatus Peribacteria bacterium]|jgi:hypothetical protein|nr:glycosyltransferase [Candidatus Peribacteria bacterium]
MMRLSVVFGTRGNEHALPHLERILTCLEQQTFQDFQVIVVIDRNFPTERERTALETTIKSWDLQILQKTKFFTHLNSAFLPPVPGKSNASYARNF